MAPNQPRVFERLPYGQRFHQEPRLKNQQAYEPTVFQVHPEIPDALTVPGDSVWSAADRDLLFTSEAGNPMDGYAYGSPEREWLLTQQKAAERIQIAHPVLYESLAAQEVLRGQARTTPLVSFNNKLLLKLENQQHQKSFKVRGAGYAIARLMEHSRPDGLVAASAGNHAQGVALAAKRHNVEAIIYMPENTPEVKQAAVRELGAKVEITGASYSDTADVCAEFLSRNTGHSYVHPFDNQDVITGQGTIAAELLAQTKDLRRVYVSVGGGGAVAGIGQVLKSYDSSIEVVGVQLTGSDAFTRSLAAGKLVTLANINMLSDGTAVRRAGKLTFEAGKTCVDRMITVTDEQMLDAMVRYHQYATKELGTNDFVEAAGALPLAAYLAEAHTQEGVSVAVCTGGNIREEHQAYVERLTA